MTQSILTAVGETHQEEGAGVEEWRGAIAHQMWHSQVLPWYSHSSAGAYASARDISHTIASVDTNE